MFKPGSVVQSAASLAANPDAVEFEPQPDHLTFVEIDDEIILWPCSPIR